MTEITSEDEHLMASEQFLKGGRDTVILVWLLNSLAVASFIAAFLAVS